MNIDIEPGTYVLAVSGGIDSMVLLDLFRKQPGLQIVVAHFDHGIREDSEVDRLLVQSVARKHGLPFVYDMGNLGPGVSEAAARKARYDFLRSVRQATGAKAIVTAHHQDDVLETAIMNLMRGTGRKGLASLKSTDLILRPLLHIPKSDIKKYAKEHKLKWREDVTNQDTKYLRNYIRHKVLSRFSVDERQQLGNLIVKTRRLNEEIERLLALHLHLQPAVDKIDRHWFIMLPHNVAREVIAAWLRKHGIRDFTTKTLDRLIVAAKTFRPGQSADIDKNYVLKVNKAVLALLRRER